MGEAYSRVAGGCQVCSTRGWRFFADGVVPDGRNGVIPALVAGIQRKASAGGGLDAANKSRHDNEVLFIRVQHYRIGIPASDLARSVSSRTALATALPLSNSARRRASCSGDRRAMWL